MGNESVSPELATSVLPLLKHAQMRFPEAIDNTMITAYRACPRKFWWRHQQLLQRGDISIHLTSGGAFARGLEVTRKRYFEDNLPFEDAICHGAAALYEAYGHVEPIPKYSNKSANNLVGALRYYFETWLIDRTMQPWRPTPTARPCIEWNFSVPIPGINHPDTGLPLLYCGRFDMVGLFENGMLLGEDDKTTGQLGQSWYDRWRLSNQILGYCWGAQAHNINLAGFTIRGVSLLKNNYGHAEAIVMVNPWQIARFVENLQTTLNKMLADYRKNIWAYDFAGSCSAYGGCDYLPLCESPEPETWIPLSYHRSEWNPLASRD